MEERLQKLLAEAAVGSRRHCEALILAGRVTVNGSTASLGMKADPERDLVFLDGRRITLVQRHTCLLLYKPPGYVSTASDPQGRPKVTDLVKLPGVRLYPVGRLDLETSGLILLTDDGELANLLTHPRYGIWKCYHALVAGVPGEEPLRLLRSGVPLPGGVTAPARVKVLKQMDDRTLLEISLRQGMKRQVREMCRQVGHQVITLRRTGLAFLTLNGLQPGKYRRLTADEVVRLKSLARRGEQA
jgi:23S rRNA pseudouridine2605 synthase